MNYTDLEKQFLSEHGSKRMLDIVNQCIENGQRLTVYAFTGRTLYATFEDNVKSAIFQFSWDNNLGWQIKSNFEWILEG